jgi:hypothetical protein
VGEQTVLHLRQSHINHKCVLDHFENSITKRKARDIAKALSHKVEGEQFVHFQQLHAQFAQLLLRDRLLFKSRFADIHVRTFDEQSV